MYEEDDNAHSSYLNNNSNNSNNNNSNNNNNNNNNTNTNTNTTNNNNISNNNNNNSNGDNYKKTAKLVQLHERNARHFEAIPEDREGTLEHSRNDLSVEEGQRQMHFLGGISKNKAIKKQLQQRANSNSNNNGNETQSHNHNHNNNNNNNHNNHHHNNNNHNNNNHNNHNNHNHNHNHSHNYVPKTTSLQTDFNPSNSTSSFSIKSSMISSSSSSSSTLSSSSSSSSPSSSLVPPTSSSFSYNSDFAKKDDLTRPTLQDTNNVNNIEVAATSTTTTTTTTNTNTNTTSAASAPASASAIATATATKHMDTIPLYDRVIPLTKAYSDPLSGPSMAFPGAYIEQDMGASFHTKLKTAAFKATANIDHNTLYPSQSSHLLDISNDSFSFRSKQSPISVMSMPPGIPDFVIKNLPHLKKQYVRSFSKKKKGEK
ncbi:hypothetical protein RFI_31480 [Reticulomyxa filosa]|uniref:Uncharacterized protein n=1 Tax=Reticulomyxa filosa TaxID=46433 RepID=X6LWD6_RETFI|nr:hypothetical protein RFI_31480 [Reticulomyxa filosa]|eukprot:ETO05914.1 hypothetical protein RFI_31480 [Reticulomyxa filosa]